MDDFKIQLKKAYDADAQRRVDNESKRDGWKLRVRQEFLELLKSKNKKSVLELGAGVGIDSKFFQDNELKVLATDLSGEMIEKCKERGLKTRILDLYSVGDLGEKFDGVFTMNVLLHVPKKDLTMILESIYNTLNPNGVFFYGVYGGTDEEKIITDDTKMSLPRLFSFLSNQTIQKIVKKWFKIIKFEIIDIGSDKPNFHFQSLFLQRKS